MSDVNDDVRRAAVVSLGFLMFRYCCVVEGARGISDGIRWIYEGTRGIYDGIRGIYEGTKIT